ncbi:MAG: NUDIX domain-containing protein [Pseudomonadales bacterium]
MERDRFPVVVHLLALSEHRLLLLRRANTGFMDGWYALPGGHQEAGESPLAAISRECQEELGVCPLEVAPLCVLPYRSGRHQGVNLVFASSGFDGEPRINEPVFDLLVWCDVENLPGPMAPWIATALDLRARGHWYQELAWD